MPDIRELGYRAIQIVALAQDYADRIEPNNTDVLSVMIGGAPCLIPHLIDQCGWASVEPYFAFSKRVSEEVHAEDGSVRKVNVFKHIGLIKAYSPNW